MADDPSGRVDVTRTHGLQVGDGNAQHNYFGPVTQVRYTEDRPGSQPGRAVYLQQVRRIAPPDPPGLIGREEELAELARFCLDPDVGSYVWWQADAWAGKSALLSAFVLRTPREVAERVRLVSFFITARLAAQDTREAFIQGVLEQLAGLLGQPLPPALPEATREAFLLDLLDQAAGACAEAGGRLVLVVDGLDEDCGVTTGPDAHSVAGLLPADPPHGMRVIAAGRPNPPVPDDVPDWHPLRDQRIIRPLAASLHAGNVRRLSRQELRRLLGGRPVEQDVLGLLTAARGGLSASDLAELASVPLWEVEGIVNASTGRTFTCRASHWTPGNRPETYLLGHEELQREAARYLGGGRLAAYQDRLHAWAGEWRGRGWPSDTPEYLLGGYFRLLEELRDLPGITSIALDQARHDRMLDVTGGDAAAMAETRTVLDRIAANETPDVAAALALACHRDQLASRNARIPAALPAVWATLGYLPRAEALASSISEPAARAEALAQVALALAAEGQHEQAAAAARSVPNRDGRAEALAGVAVGLAASGCYHQACLIAAEAEEAARSLINPGRQIPILAQVAGVLAAAGQHKRAATLARSLAGPGPRAEAIAQVAVALAAAGQHEPATAVAAEAEAAARSVSSPRWRALALARAAGAMAAAGQREQAAVLAAESETVARALTRQGVPAEDVALVAAALAATGKYEQAVTAARSVADPGLRAEAMAQVAEALAVGGQHEQATVSAAEAEALARSIGSPAWRAVTLAQITAVLAKAGQHEKAAGLAADASATARSLDPERQARTLERVAIALAKAGQHEQATALARSITSPDRRVLALESVARALATAGQRDQLAAIAAEADAANLSVTLRRAHTVARVTAAMAAAGRHVPAAGPRNSADPGISAEALVQAAVVLTADGQYQQAIAVARSVTEPDWQLAALAQLADALDVAGQHEPAAVILAEAATAAQSLTGVGLPAEVLAQAAKALAKGGYSKPACRLAAAACATGEWTIAAKPALLLAPSAATLVMSLLNAQ